MRSTVLLVAFSTMSVLACGGDDTTGPQTGNGTPTVASVVVTPVNATLVSFGETVQLTASALDASGNAISGKTFTWSSSDEGLATVSSSGLVTAAANGSVTITATSDGVSGTAAVDVNQVAAQLTFTVEPPTLAEATVPITPAVEVAIQDALGNTVTATSDAVTVAIGTNPSGGILLGTTTVNAAAAVASFSGLSIDRAGTGYTLVATSGNLSSATSATFTVVSGGTWTLTGNMGVPRRNHRATLLNDGKVLIVGGQFPPLAELYDPATGSFTATGNILSLHGPGVNATKLLDGRVLIVGGASDDTFAEIYDPATGIFSLTARTNAQRVFHTATLLSDGRVLLAGGTNPSPGQSLAAAELYDPVTGTFSPTGSLNDDRSGPAATLLPDGRVLVVGGTQTTIPGVGICLASAEIYDPASGTFSTTGSMQQGRCGLLFIGVHLLSNGKVLVVGGNIAAAELFDPATGTFSATGSMAMRHSAGTATLLSDGTVLIASGAVDAGPVMTDAAELYDPAAGLFIQLAASLNEARQQHTATLLLDGRVLLTGGFSSAVNDNVSSAELYAVRIP